MLTRNDVALPSQPLGIEARSIGVKLLLIGALAILMTIPALFVSGLVSERSQNFTNAGLHTPATTTNSSASHLHMVDSYRSVDRSLKYVLLFLGLVFLTYFVFEVTTGKRVHPAQYALVGTAQLIFYLLLLSIAEKIGFDIAFLLAGGSTVALLSINAAWVFDSRPQGRRAAVAFTMLYGLIYLLLRLENDALLIGALASFVAIAGVLYVTRHIDWYSSLSTEVRQAPATVPPPPPM